MYNTLLRFEERRINMHGTLCIDRKVPLLILSCFVHIRAIKQYGSISTEIR